MGNALLFTALLLGAAVLGGFIGSCCSKGRQAGDHEGRIAELEDRLDALATHCMDEAKRLKDRTGSLEGHLQGIFERLYEVELLIGDTPTGGLLGRVGALEDAQKKDAEVVEALRLKHNELADAYETTASHAKSALAMGDALMDEFKEHRDKIGALKKELEGLQMVNEEEHRVLQDVILALNKHGHGCVVGLDAELIRKKGAQGGR